MTVTLIVLAAIAATNPFRAAAASPADRPVAPGVAAAAVLVAVGGAALASGPLLDAIDVTGPSAGIAAGIALVAVCLKDLIVSPPAAEPGLGGWQAGLIPLAFPVMFSPALALLALAAGADRGVAVAVAAVAPAVLLAAAAATHPPRRFLRAALSTVAGVGVGLGALVVLDGVYSI